MKEIKLRTTTRAFDALHTAVEGRKKVTVEAQALIDLLLDHSVMFNRLRESGHTVTERKQVREL